MRIAPHWCHLEAEGLGDTWVPGRQSNSDHSHTEHRIPRTLLSTPHALTHLILPTTTRGRNYNRQLTDEAAETQW